jgi:hypothetical protein
VIAFPAHRILAAHARSFVSSMTRELAIDNAAEAGSARPPSIWEAFVRAVKHSLGVLESSPLVLIFKERGEGAQRHAECRQVGLHMPPFNAWGVQFRACGRGCTVVASDLSFRWDKGAMRCHCKTLRLEVLQGQGRRRCRHGHELVCRASFRVLAHVPAVPSPSQHVFKNHEGASGLSVRCVTIL